MSAKDPYAVLGISPEATDEQVKSAYREMARKYHPDNYTNNPLSDLAQEKMQEINEAYDSIIRIRKQGKSYNNGQSGYSGGYSQSSSGSQYADIRAMINSGRVLDAEMLLDGIPTASRDAEWYFLKGSVLYRKGWLEDAFSHFSTASRMDPSNTEYREAVNQMNSQRQTGGYRTTNNYGGSDCTGCDICSSLLCADCCCECMGGSMTPCC